jgi:phosphoribosylformylglycinamidine synthase I
MPSPRVLILRAPGTNCDRETAYAFERAGAVTEPCHINRLLESPQRLLDFQIACLPGGFSYGDDIAAGRILANQFRHHLTDFLREFRDAGKLIFGICNGFQILIKSGILLEDEPAGPPATLTWNESGRYTDRWVHVQATGDRCVFLRGIERMFLPIAHAEGKFVTRDLETLARLRAAGQLALRYTTEAGTSSMDEPLPFPANPNGAWANVAGVCDPTGRVFGLMPHPERHIDHTHHPHWTRLAPREVGDGFKVFQNAVAYFA